MNLAFALMIAIPAIAILFAVALRGRIVGRRRLIVVSLVLFCCVIATAIFQTSFRTPAPDTDNERAKDVTDLVTDRPIEDPSNGYVGSNACQIVMRMNPPPGTRPGTAR